jgi:glycosyltransferase involved in cell wall biosynthesis
LPFPRTKLLASTAGKRAEVGAHLQPDFAYTADIRNLFRGPLAKKTVVFSPLGIQTEQLGSPRTPRQTPPKLLYAGRLLYWKGVYIAIQAFAKLLTKIPAARFTIVGTEPEEARLKADTLHRKIRDNVDFTSWLPQRKLFELYDSHDLPTLSQLTRQWRLRRARSLVP